LPWQMVYLPWQMVYLPWKIVHLHGKIVLFRWATFRRKVALPLGNSPLCSDGNLYCQTV
jgi:hypothetical protein